MPIYFNVKKKDNTPAIPKPIISQTDNKPAKRPGKRTDEAVPKTLEPEKPVLTENDYFTESSEEE